jgi:hypothetical protein
LEEREERITQVLSIESDVRIALMDSRGGTSTGKGVAW